MAPPEKIDSTSLQEQRWQEIPKPELRKYSPELKEALEVICNSTAFRTSPKSCEFLRHIVLHALKGDLDVLKERLIGMALLGRDASYDTSTDAGVRVRANDVRKRLAAFNDRQENELCFSFRLPAGSYIPLFLRVQPEETKFIEPAAVAIDNPPPLSFYRLAAPTLAALFLCVICMRWQLAQEHSFASFWQQVLRDDRAMLYMPPSHADNGQDLFAMQELKTAAPLLDLAGEFHHRFTLISAPPATPASGSLLVYVDTASPLSVAPRSTAAFPDSSLSYESGRFVIEHTAQGRAIFDRRAPNPQQSLHEHAALLTIANGTPSLIHIDGTDDAAIRMLVEQLCNESTFPAELADSFRPGTMTQALFPSAPNAEPTIVHEPVSRLQADLEP